MPLLAFVYLPMLHAPANMTKTANHALPSVTSSLNGLAGRHLYHTAQHSAKGLKEALLASYL